MVADDSSVPSPPSPPGVLGQSHFAEAGIPLDRELARQMAALREAGHAGSLRSLYEAAWGAVAWSLARGRGRLSFRPQPLDPRGVLLDPGLYRSLRLAEPAPGLSVAALLRIRDPLLLDGDVPMDVHVHYAAPSLQEAAAEADELPSTKLGKAPTEALVSLEPAQVPKQPPPSKKSSYLAGPDKMLVRTILAEQRIPAGSPDAEVRVTAAQAKNFWRWSKENASRAEGGGSLTTKTTRLREAFGRCTEIVPDTEQ